VEVEFAEPRTEEELERYYRLRYERLRKEWGLPEGSERDHPAEAGSSHIVAKVDSRIIGAACYAVGMTERHGERLLYVRFRQLAVDAQFEGHGIGSALMRLVEERARGIGAKEIVGNVRVDNVAYFERHGWIVLGEGEPLYGFEHVSMAKPL
jgi:GNAT superfamily N-acetyltransferase